MMKCFLSSYFQLLYLLIAALLECRAQTERLCEQVHKLDITCFQGGNAGNVTLDLKDIKSSDGGLYDCQIYKDQDCLHATQFNLNIIKCKTLDSVHSTPGSSVLLPCSEHPLQHRTEQVTWKVVTGHKPTDIDNYHLPKKSSSSKEKLPKPLYERVRKQANGSLLISDVVHTDQMWYQCRVNEKNCYEVKLVMKDRTFFSTISTTSLSTVITDAPTPADSTVASETLTVNLTVVVMTTIVSLCVLISLTVCVIIYFKNPRSKINSQSELKCWSTVYYSNISGGFDGPFYALDERNT